MYGADLFGASEAPEVCTAHVRPLLSSAVILLFFALQNPLCKRRTSCSTPACAKMHPQLHVAASARSEAVKQPSKLTAGHSQIQSFCTSA